MIWGFKDPDASEEFMSFPPKASLLRVSSFSAQALLEGMALQKSEM